MEKINVDKLFTCFNCGYMVDEPHESECCGKLYCQTCVNEIGHAQCKLCKKQVKLRENLFAKNLMQSVELTCRDGCGGKFLYEDMKLHMYRCNSRIFKCNVDFCNFVGTKCKLLPHMILTHEVHLLTMMENYEEFQEEMDKVAKDPIDKRSKLVKNAISNDLEIRNIRPVGANRDFTEMFGFNDRVVNLNDSRTRYEEIIDYYQHFLDNPRNHRPNNEDTIERQVNPNQRIGDGSDGVDNSFIDEYNPMDSMEFYRRSNSGNRNQINNFNNYRNQPWDFGINLNDNRLNISAGNLEDIRNLHVEDNDRNDNQNNQSNDISNNLSFTQQINQETNPQPSINNANILNELNSIMNLNRSNQRHISNLNNYMNSSIHSNGTQRTEENNQSRGQDYNNNLNSFSS